MKVGSPAVKTKVVYVKFLHLADKERGKPIFYRRLRGFSKPVPVYDLALYCVYEIFNERHNSFYEWRFQSSEGQIDNVTQLHPFAGPTHDSYPVGNPGSWTHRIHNLTSNEVFFVVPHYNSFQRKHEDVFAIVEERIGELRLIVDFSSIIVDEDKDLFVRRPKAFVIKGKERKEVEVEYEAKEILSATVKDIEEAALCFEWEVNWENLGPKELSKEIPPEYVQDYYEAAKVLEISPKASAALSRRCLQKLLRDKEGIRMRNLNSEIQYVIDNKKLPPYLSQALHYVREIGNLAAHPEKNEHTGEIVEVKDGEAEWNLKVLHDLFNFYFEEPAERARRIEDLNKKLAELGKPTIK